jgi:cysteine desulfurase
MEETNLSSLIPSIYLDYQASTPLDPRVLEKMMPYMTDKYGNPHSSEHSVGWAANEAVEKAKGQVAAYLNALDDEIICISGSTESNNLAIIGIGYAALDHTLYSKRRRILVSSIEHKCVLGASRFLARFGFTVEKIPVEGDGLINLDRFKSLLSDDVLLVSVMSTNNEIGVNEPIREIGRICKEHGILFHVDASQGAYAALDIIEDNADFMSISAHKIYGPKGTGALFISGATSLKPVPLMNGGGQQGGYRSGTIPTFLAVGLGEACSIMQEVKETEAKNLKNLQTILHEGMKSIFPTIRLNGNSIDRHPGNLNFTIPGIDAKQFILSLQPHIAFSTGSACTSGIIEPSHVLKAIGLSTEEADSSFRMSVGRFTTETDIGKAIKIIKKRVEVN